MAKSALPHVTGSADIHFMQMSVESALHLANQATADWSRTATKLSLRVERQRLSFSSLNSWQFIITMKISDFIQTDIAPLHFSGTA